MVSSSKIDPLDAIKQGEHCVEDMGDIEVLIEMVERRRTEVARLRSALEKWRPAVERAVKWSEQLGNERDARGFAAMLADFDSALDRDKCR